MSIVHNSKQRFSFAIYFRIRSFWDRPTEWASRDTKKKKKKKKTKSNIFNWLRIRVLCKRRLVWRLADVDKRERKKQKNKTNEWRWNILLWQAPKWPMLFVRKRKPTGTIQNITARCSQLNKLGHCLRATLKRRKKKISHRMNHKVCARLCRWSERIDKTTKKLMPMLLLPVRVFDRRRVVGVAVSADA